MTALAIPVREMWPSSQIQMQKTRRRKPAGSIRRLVELRLKAKK
jgi:hypothetical protein